MDIIWILSIEFQLNWYINQKKLDFEIIYFELYSGTLFKHIIQYGILVPIYFPLFSHTLICGHSNDWLHEGCLPRIMSLYHGM